MAVACREASGVRARLSALSRWDWRNIRAGCQANSLAGSSSVSPSPARSPTIRPSLVADEPTGNLDSTTAHQVFDTLAGLIERGKTVIYVTHDRELASRASARIELLDGRIASEAGASAVVRAEQGGGAS